nr:DNA-(apurinic or apyrimidinic site) endonuclease isoform X2 [Caretta caretta]XP_048675382.1 DNA-(apurinic or apyrimidinic site) endonuclease isoform X2 [Caretta caretta]
MWTARTSSRPQLLSTTSQLSFSLLLPRARGKEEQEGGSEGPQGEGGRGPHPVPGSARQAHLPRWAEVHPEGHIVERGWAPGLGQEEGPGGEEEHDQEGRVITAEFPSHFLVTAYVPNAGRGLVRLEYRQRWDAAFRAYLQGLDARKPLVLCGDLNVAHAEIDLKNPKGNKKSAGFTPEERQGFGELLAAGFTDTFRHLYPDTPHAYTFWTYMMNARAKNVGWRLDYFLVSMRLLGALCDSKIRSQAMGSDHCPVTLYMAL